MPRLNDHGLGGGGKSLGVPVYPFNTKGGYVTSENGPLQAIYGNAITTIPASSYSNAGCAVGDNIYLIGMMDSNTACYKYNVATKKWTKLANSPADARKNWAVTDGRYVYYGCDESTAIYSYDTVGNTHATAVSFANHRMDYSRATIDGDYIYVFGGNIGTTDQAATRVDIVNKTYTSITRIPTGMYNQCVVSGGDGYIYLFGGQVSSTTAYKYSIANNTYTRISDVPFNCYGTMSVRIDNYIYLINMASSALKPIYAYDILTNTYTSLGSTPQARQYGIAGLINDVIYMVGGGTTSTQYTSGESLMVIKGTSANLLTRQLPQGVKVHTNGEVNSGTAKDFDGITIFKTDATLEKKNGAVTTPGDGDYAIVGGSYATIGG